MHKRDKTDQTADNQASGNQTVGNRTADRQTARGQIATDIEKLLRNHGDRSFRPKEIAKKLGYSDQKAYRLSRAVLEELAESGTIQKIKGGQFSYRSAQSVLKGVLSVHPDGYGFVSVEGEENDFFVRSRRMKNAMDRDKVEIGTAAPVKGDRRREAEIIRVIERGRSFIVGTFRSFGSFQLVIPDDPRLRHEIYIADERANGAREGDKVVVTLDASEDARLAPQGQITKVLGSSDDPAVQTLSVAIGSGVSVLFPKDVTTEAGQIDPVIQEAVIQSREDLRDMTIFTIDPEDARDFDDAIHVRQLDGGLVELGVHIADVSHFVRPGGAIDREARERGTSVYLVDRVIPMLPENLSNNVCSLRPDEDRLAFSCIMTITTDGTITGHRIAETVIRSTRRLTYQEAQAIIDSGPDDEDSLARELGLAADLARVLLLRRQQSGAVEFDLPEVKVILDEAGHVESIQPRERLFAHRLVEECMLAANRTIAERMESTELPFVYRVHEHPDRERIRQLAAYVRSFGLQLPNEEGKVKPEDLNALLKSIQGTPREPIIKEAALRAMAKARYSPDHIGHYGLALRSYTHFTSPIRRYPDLIVHRLVKNQLLGAPAATVESLKETCDLASERERVAVDAERSSVRQKQVAYASKHVGDTFDGVIRGVTKFGVYVLLHPLLVEGMVHVRDMRDDYYEFDERSFSLRGERTKTVYRPGDTVRVILTAARTETFEIDLAFAHTRERRRKRPKKKRR